MHGVADAIARKATVAPLQPGTHSATVNVLATERVSPLQCDNFQWPSQVELVECQRAAVPAENNDGVDVQWNESAGYFLTPAGEIWLPSSPASLDLRTRL